ncbi:hypothetical protein BO70DRAFT_106504 [Aspergillus heteromorphus CBS 117.55]|uniref:Uncharacterized protein n=1 Tax=Aspergillus heteromorphus CBS 117.55 TaxID=1448321 RepID=A0A317VJD6_9EURO|nr:uncharacterized protein BO70DRAFT_106504 [Aspergillus heteromorphus CBS 117.55]PWY74426.1 hypothetical protein BO70DRAFT_106504 [Aspergillus heteromorphus CBS 117.55]
MRTPTRREARPRYPTDPAMGRSASLPSRVARSQMVRTGRGSPPKRIRNPTAESSARLSCHIALAAPVCLPILHKASQGFLSRAKPCYYGGSYRSRRFPRAFQKD